MLIKSLLKRMTAAVHFYSSEKKLTVLNFQLGSDSCVVKADAMTANLDATALKACKEEFPKNPATDSWFWLGSCSFADIDTKFDRLFTCYNNVMILVSGRCYKRFKSN